MKTKSNLISISYKSIPDQNRTQTRTKTALAGLPLGFHPSMPGTFSHISASSIWRPILLPRRNDKAPAFAPQSRHRDRFTAQQISTVLTAAHNVVHPQERNLHVQSNSG